MTPIVMIANSKLTGDPMLIVCGKYWYIVDIVAWGAKFESITNQRIDYFQEQHVARAVHGILSVGHVQMLKAGLGYYATLLFTIEGHNNAYLTTESLYELPLGKTYRFVTGLLGEGLSFPAKEGIYIELNNWNDIYVNYDNPIIRGYRAIVRWTRKLRSPKPSAAVEESAA